MTLINSDLTFIKSTINNILEGVDYELILFGSYAKSEHTDNSDIDIAIKATEKLNLSKWALIEESFDESNLQQKVDLIDYHRVKDSFKRIIDETGVRL